MPGAVSYDQAMGLFPGAASLSDAVAGSSRGSGSDLSDDPYAGLWSASSMFSAADYLSRQAEDRQWNREQSAAAAARDFASSEAARDRAWQAEMSNTAYQRAVTDMRLAGLNPYLMYANGGSGASTPGGAMASAAQASAPQQNFDFTALIPALTSLVSTAQRASSAKLQAISRMTSSFFSSLTNVLPG